MCHPKTQKWIGHCLYSGRAYSMAEESRPWQVKYGVVISITELEFCSMKSMREKSSKASSILKNVHDRSEHFWWILKRW